MNYRLVFRLLDLWVAILRATVCRWRGHRWGDFYVGGYSGGMPEQWAACERCGHAEYFA